jgi:ABC-2 type transport system ATP-binding protein
MIGRLCRVVAEGTAAELMHRVVGKRLDLRAVGAAAYAELSASAGATHKDPAALTLGVPTDGTAAHVRALLDELDPARRLVAEFSVRGATLDDVFLALTKETRDA